jgi:hypothetical protein
MKVQIRQLQNIYGMARVGYIGELEVYVNTNDAGNIPHFRLRDSDDWDKFHTCIKILSPEYFLHEGKEDILNSKQRKELQEFMESKVSVKRYTNKFQNNWELVCFLWDMNNSNISIPDNAEMPNYLELK